MRRFAALLALAAVPTLAEAHYAGLPGHEFELEACAVRATHILVVDAQGVVIESWKGTARPGDVVPLELLMSPAYPRQTSLAFPTSDPFVNLGEYWYDRPPACERMILFLVKSVPPPKPLDELRLGYFLEKSRPMKWDPDPDWADGVAEVGRNRVSLVMTGKPASPNELWKPAGVSLALSVAWIDANGFARVRGRESRTPESKWDKPPPTPVWKVFGWEYSFRNRVTEAVAGPRWEGWH